MTWTNERNGELLERARKVIPGGMYGHHSTAMLPDVFPQFFSRAEGTRLWDADGNAYIDYACAFGPNLFGYRHARIEAAARRQMEFGDTMTAPAPVMIDLAEQFVAMVTHADWAMFCKNGSDATSMAMMVARAYSRRRTILVAEGAYHGSSMWSTPRLAGTLPEDRAHIVTYRYNDVESLETAFRKHRGDIAGVFASPFKHDAFRDQSLPDPTYAVAARRLCDAEDSLLIIDDVRAGFRIARDCSWSALGVQPDLSAWGKGTRQRPSDLCTCRLRTFADRGAEHLCHRLVLVLGRAHGGRGGHAARGPGNRLSRAHHRLRPEAARRSA
jgi:glutamate-1-semialdehyde 2,1-aminomutase